ncbi:MAG: type II toxin-antitoxin system Phd/YefM family antitoxin [Planctomycetota bacterium]
MMNDSKFQLNLSEARTKLTQLDKLLKPGESLQVNKRGKPYARIELLGDIDKYEQVLESIEALPDPPQELLPVAENYKSILYGSDSENA